MTPLYYLEWMDGIVVLHFRSKKYIFIMPCLTDKEYLKCVTTKMCKNQRVGRYA